MSILVTGSAGHLGEALMRTLRAQGRPATGVDLVPSPYTDRVGSIADRAFVDRVMAGVHAVVHTATLHKPHVATHSRQDFLDTNVTGTLNLLEAAAAHGVTAFVFTSTTSAYGDALTPADDAPAAWIDENVAPVVKNIYGATKLAAEDLCRLFHRNQRLPCLVLRTSRFFPEPDDSPAKRNAFVDANLKANEFLYRRADVQDIVDAHLLAIERAPQIGFGRYILSATTPFTRDDLAELRAHAPAVVSRRVPGYEAEYARRGWRVFPGIERVYDNTLARQELGWRPTYDFAHVLDRLRADEDPRSPLAQAIGAKGYHAGAYSDGLYPVEN
ncbi:UDP-glucose 4-epimerase [Lysobacter niastensis]|uniref:UDP-glucose 4-epimerase n=1 Tax=Lysobacter niastensis TaxID=380629 RepID=A0ABU1WEH3_9GAMM|nr:NAD(P)-dependent oxidoreductase [Lysobacter niastensis]MDR7136001.1 UDP-glucose 4-epimerase [Lysobacter niastensis]